MSRVESLSRQHQEMMERIKRIRENLKREKLQGREGASSVRKTLSELSGMLKMHMLREDDFLYPELLDRGEDRVRKVAQNFINDMGGLADQFQEYNRKYLSYSAIQENSDQFIRETTQVLALLERRMQKEDKELYVLL